MTDRAADVLRRVGGLIDAAVDDLAAAQAHVGCLEARLADLRELRAALMAGRDSDDAAAALISWIWDAVGCRSSLFTVAQLRQIAGARGDCPLDVVSHPHVVGRRLARLEGQSISGFFFDRAGTENGSFRWVIRQGGKD